ncbi:MAG: peptidoglycan recognition family protein [Thermoproteota archaeon]
MPVKVQKRTGNGEWVLMGVPDSEVESRLKALNPNRPIRKIIIHHTGFDAPFKGIESWYQIHRSHQQRGWKGIGYHIGISPEGRVSLLRPISLIGAHCEGHNSDSVGVVVWGWKNKTHLQLTRLAQVVALLQKKFNAEVYFHRDLGNTICPDINREQFKKILKQFGGEMK